MADFRYKSIKSWKIDNIDWTQQFTLSIFADFCYQSIKITWLLPIFIDWLLRALIILMMQNTTLIFTHHLWCFEHACRRGSRINTDWFPKRALKIQASRGICKYTPPGNFWILTPKSPLSLVSESFIRDIGQFIILGWSLANRRIISSRLISMLCSSIWSKLSTWKVLYYEKDICYEKSDRFP